MNTSSVARHRWIALTLLSAIEFMILLDTSIVNIALPTIQAGLHFSEADLGWVQNIYLLIFGASLLFGGRAADLFGRRRLFLLGLALFTLSSLLAGLAPSAAILLLARALQGLGATAVIPAEQSLLATIFTDPQEFNRAFGIWSAMGAAGQQCARKALAGLPSQEQAQTRGVHATLIHSQPSGALLQTVTRLIDEGHIKAIASKSSPLSSAQQAHEYGQSGHGRGRIVLTVE